MFERYTEKARRVIIFARYEATQFGSPYIEAEHLLLGLLREHKALNNLLLRSDSSMDSIRKQIVEHITIREKLPTSVVDLPLSNECKRILAYAAEEAERLSHKHIGTEHLLLGLLREEKCFAANLLHTLNISLDQAREWVAEQQAEATTLHRPNRAIQRQELVRFSSSGPIAVAILTEDKERLAVLQQAVEATKVGCNVFAHTGFPTGQTDPLLHQIEDRKAEAVIIDIEPKTPERAIQAISLINANISYQVVIFAVGPLTHPQTIISAMRAGAREYLEKNATSETILEAFSRLAASLNRKPPDPGPGGMWTGT